jgi:hypothetical protein
MCTSWWTPKLLILGMPKHHHRFYPGTSTWSKTTAIWSLAFAKLEYAGEVGVHEIVASFATWQ